MRNHEVDRTAVIAGLIVKYLEGVITREEEDLLNEWREEKQANQLLFNRLIETEKTGIALGKVQQIEERKQLRLQAVIDRISQPQPTLIHLFFAQKRKYIVAASIVLLISVTAFLYINRNTTVDKNDRGITAERYKNDVPPGGNKATLTLADGSTLTLDSAGNGTLARQGNTNVLKLTAGQLAYNATGKTSPKEVFYNILSTPRGGQFQVLLPDNSRVWLNAASSLRFPTAFTDRERKVELTGEAYFEIAKDQNRPFRVTIVPPSSGVPAWQNQENLGEVEVVGTHFNVMAYDDESNISTTLLEGAVKVKKGTATTLLAPGQQAELNKNGNIKLIKNADADGAVAWKNGLFSFRSADTKTIMRQIARWYDVQVVYEGKIQERQLTGEAPRSISLATLLRVLELNDVHFRIEGRKIIVMQ